MPEKLITGECPRCESEEIGKVRWDDYTGEASWWCPNCSTTFDAVRVEGVQP